MPKSDYDFTFKFFRPPQRTVAFHNGLLDTRTKHTIAQDRLVVAEQRVVEAERRKSVSTLQLLSFEQKQLEKRLASLHNNFSSTLNSRPLQMRGRSTSEVIFRNIHRSSSWTEPLPKLHPKLSVSLHNSKQNLLTLPKLDAFQRRSSDDDLSENPSITSDIESDENSKSKFSNSKKRFATKRQSLPKPGSQRKPLPPIVAIIPPDEEVLFLTQ